MTSLKIKREVLIKKRGLTSVDNIDAALMVSSFFKGRHSFKNLESKETPYKKKQIIEEFQNLEKSNLTNNNNNDSDNDKLDNFRFNKFEGSEEEEE